MIPNINPIAQAMLGTLFTWALTAAGAGMVVIINGTQRKFLDASLGFAGGVMTAASYWSLLAPAIEMAEESGMYGEKGEYAFLPALVGFFFGALFVYGTDFLISSMGINSSNMVFGLEDNNKNAGPLERASVIELEITEGLNKPNLTELDALPEEKSLYKDIANSAALASDRRYSKEKADDDNYRLYDVSTVEEVREGKEHTNMLSRRRVVNSSANHDNYDCSSIAMGQKNDQWKRIVLLIVAITVHNIPEGLAVGVGFGAIGRSASATFENARNLAVGIGIQNFPEGLAVSLPLKAAGFSTFRSFWYGQLSGMVEPVFGIIGAAAVGVATPILPYALAFAAGAMIYVVVDDIIPEAHTSGNGKLATWGAILGFLVMMVLDVGLG